MNQIEELERAVRAALPAALTRLDPPGRPSGTWWLDIEHGGHSATVEWRRGAGFGVSSSDAEGFEGSDERHATLKSTAGRVVSLLTSGERTKPPRAVALPALRARKAMSQEKLAGVLGVKQAQISKLERQGNMRLSTLRKLVGALGGELEIRARFRDESGDVIIAGPWSPQVGSKSSKKSSTKSRIRKSRDGRRRTTSPRRRR